MRSNKRTIQIVIIVAVLLIPVYQWISGYYDTGKLKESKKCFAKLIEVHYNTAVHGSAFGVLKYEVAGTSFIIKDLGDYRMMKTGDSVLIEYATKDHSVARVVDKYYMQKYRHLKKHEK